MSGTASTSVVTVGVGGGGELGYGGYRAPFTPVQWQELEHQAMIYKYLVAGLPVPPDLVMPIRRSFDALSSRFFNHPSLGYCSYYGKKFDPEPGRCRRTDGKKWRCSKDAHPDSKYCERHMHRGRNRSRKPVESQTTSQSLSTSAANVSTGGGSGNSGSFQSGGNESFQNMPLYSVASTEGAAFGGSMMQMEPVLYGINNNREFSFSHGASANVESLGLGTGTGSGAWRLMPTQVSSTSLLDQKSDAQLLGHSSAQQNVPIDGKQQHCFFGSEIGSPGSVKQQEQQHPVHPFFSEWPSTKESWSNLDDDDGSNKNIFSSTQLSISIPRASSDFPSRSAYSPNDG